MILEKEFKKLIDELTTKEAALFSFSGTPIQVRVFDEGSKLSLNALVYEGGNYIPGSVRRCLGQKPPFKPMAIKTSLKVNEDTFQISLQYLGGAESINSVKFQMLLEDFSFLVDEWRSFLDEHDKNDLVHVRVK